MSQKLITKADIAAGKPFILKWTGNPVDNDGVYNPGWKQQLEADRFLELIEERPSIMNDARFIPMESIEYDVSFLTLDVELKSMRQLAGDNVPGGQIDNITSLDESVPAFSRSKLVAHPFIAYTYTTKTFLLENIEKQAFLNHIEAILAERAGYSAELIGMYGIKKASGATASGYDHINGVFQQLKDIRTLYDAAVSDESVKPYSPQGFYEDIDTTESLVKQMKEMIAQFTKQKGKRASAKFYVSSEMESNLILEAEGRETDEGDNLYFKDNQLYLWGVPIVAADFLDDVRNGWIDTPAAEEATLEVKDLVLIANPDSLVFGFLNRFESENEYSVAKKAYLSSIDVYYDVLVLLNKDALAARVITPIE